MFNFRIIVLALTSIWSHLFYSQTVEKPKISFTDSLKERSYKELYVLFYYNKDNDTLYDIYAREYIKKAYRELDTLNIARGYYLITLEDKDHYFQLNDSLIKYSRIIKSHYWLWMGYHGKGSYFFRHRNFQKAFENHLEAFKYAEEGGYKELKNLTQINLGLLRERIGRQEEALQNFKESYKYELKKVRKKSIEEFTPEESSSFLNSMSRLANSYRLNNKTDSAHFINEKIRSYDGLHNSQTFIDIACLSSAEISFDSKEYLKVIDSVNRVLPYLLNKKDINNAAIGFHIRGMSRFYIKQKEKGIQDLQQMDSIFNIQGDLYPSLRSGYLTLIKFFKDKKDLKKQLYYVEQLIRFDSIIHDNYAYIWEGFNEKIDKPNLIEQQKQLKKELDKTSRISRIWYFIGLSIILLLGLEIYRRKRIIHKKNKEKEELHEYYKEKFDALIKQNNITTSEHQKSLPANEITSESTSDKLEISDDVINAVLKALRIFEDKKLFVDADLTATSLAKDFGTNANYLGKIVKFQYEKSFRNYVNDLRLDLALDKLRNDKSFKNYSVQAMANEVGFKNAEPFSKAFKSRTGFYPSEFISQIKTSF